MLHDKLLRKYNKGLLKAWFVAATRDEIGIEEEVRQESYGSETSHGMVKEAEKYLREVGERLYVQ
jgi:hypothetical protein